MATQTASTKQHRCSGCGQLTDDSAGLPSLNQGLSVLWLLPEAFARAYEELFHTAYRLGTDGVGMRDPDSQRSSKPRRAGKMQASGTGKKFKPGHWVVASQRSYERKQYVDRQLRKLARWITSRALDGEELVYRCPQGCGAWIETGWHFCTKCGHNLTADMG